MTIPFRDALKVWSEIGVTGFGGPARQIALMHRLLVEERGWIGEAEYLRGARRSGAPARVRSARDARAGRLSSADGRRLAVP